MNQKIETDYYPEIAELLVLLISENLKDPSKYKIIPLVGEISSGLRTLLVNGYDASEELLKYMQSIHRLYLDISILVENKETKKFDLIIFEVKIGKTVGLTQLSQLIGYCLVSKVKFGVLLNIDDRISDNFATILDSDGDLTRIQRVIGGDTVITHELGVMVYNSSTKNLEYTNSGAIKTIPLLVEKIEEAID